MSVYAIVRRGRQIEAPVSLRSRWNGIPAFHLLSDEERKGYGWYPCTVVNEDYDVRTHWRSTFPECVFDPETETVEATYVLIERPLEEVRAERLADLAARRYQAETAGIEVAGVTVATDRQSQAMLNSAYTACLPKPGRMIDWKGMSAWARLGQADITALADAVADHVQSCFSRERALAEQIAAAETAAEVVEIDIDAGWPGGEGA